MSVSSLQAIFYSGDLGTKVYELPDTQPLLLALGYRFLIYFETFETQVLKSFQ